MAEFWSEKRVVISPDAASLADSVAARLLGRLAKQTADGLDAHVSLTGGSMGGAVLAAAAKHPEAREGRLVARPLLVERRALGPARRRRPQREAGSRGAPRPARAARRQHPRDRRERRRSRTGCRGRGVCRRARALRLGRGRCLAVLRRVLPRRRPRRAHRVAVPGSRRDPRDRPSGAAPCGTPPSRRRSASR